MKQEENSKETEGNDLLGVLAGATILTGIMAALIYGDYKSTYPNIRYAANQVRYQHPEKVRFVYRKDLNGDNFEDMIFKLKNGHERVYFGTRKGFEFIGKYNPEKKDNPCYQSRRQKTFHSNKIYQLRWNSHQLKQRKTPYSNKR